MSDDPSTEDNDESVAATEIMGTYEGAMGVYKCNAAGCSVTVDGEGTVSAVSGDNDWIFIPADGVTVDVADTDYLHYGFWLKRTTDEDGVLTYNEVETFAGSSVAASGDVSSVTGTATYEGGATGVYVHTVDNPDGTRNRATSGHFTADASLTATFGQTAAQDIAPNQLNTLTGTISDFELSGGEANVWEVTLNRSMIDTSAGTATGTTTGGGSYDATFHGPM